MPSQLSDRHSNSGLTRLRLLQHRKNKNALAIAFAKMAEL
jgi:hypothetical protein